MTPGVGGVDVDLVIHSIVHVLVVYQLTHFCTCDLLVILCYICGF